MTKTITTGHVTSMTPNGRLAFSPLQQERLSTITRLPDVLKANVKSVNVITKEALGAMGDHEKIKEKFKSTYGQPRVEFEISGSSMNGGGSDITNNKDNATNNNNNNNSNISASNTVGAIGQEATTTTTTSSTTTTAGNTTRPYKVGCVLSGGQAAGGHNVIAGLYDYMKDCNQQSEIYGFVNGPRGIMTGKYILLNDGIINQFRNTGGFDMLGSGRDKIEKTEEFESALKFTSELSLDGLIVIGGDDSNTNAALLAEFFQQNGSKCKVIGCPKTIDGDLKNQFIPISFGFDTACKTYSELIGNVAIDCLSSQKYYHFVRLMGRSASHIALECAFQTRPNAVLLGEEIMEKNLSLSDITQQLVQIIQKRAEAGKNYGVILLPEGLIEFIPEFNNLISEINELMANGIPCTEEAIMDELSFNNRAVFAYLPSNIKEQLMLDRDPHGNVQVAKIETEKLLAGTIAQELHVLKNHKKYDGKFDAQFHSFGYEGRAGLPSSFDSNYCQALGRTAGVLIAKELNCLMASITNISAPVEEWVCGGVPITMMMNMERRHGKDKPVIKKALVELDQRPFKAYCELRDDWAVNDLYRCPGPIQFSGDTASAVSFTLRYELDGKVDDEIPGMKREGKMFNNFLFSPTPDACMSETQKLRRKYIPDVPLALKSTSISDIDLEIGERTQCLRSVDRKGMKREFPSSYGLPIVKMESKRRKLEVPSNLESKAILQKEDSFKASNLLEGVVLEEEQRFAIVFSGRQAPGGHNIVTGVFDFLKDVPSKLFGVIGGIQGMRTDSVVELNDELLFNYRNQAGFDLLGRSSESFEKAEDFKFIKTFCENLNLNGLIFVGACRTATTVAYLNEYFTAEGIPTKITCVPSGIDGSLTNQLVETTVGYDTACKVYSQLVGNTSIDGASAKKYYYFLRVMGADPSNIALEVALKTHPNMTILAEEVDAHRMSFKDIINQVADTICCRSKAGKDYGTILVPEGLASSIAELGVLIHQIDSIFRDSKTRSMSIAEATDKLTVWSAALLKSMPVYIQQQLLKERQSDNQIQLSQIETERLISHFVDEELKIRKQKGLYNGKFNPVCSFLGYQARGSMPSNFDCDYAYSLGGVAASLLYNGFTGYVATISGLKGPSTEWQAAGVPITSMMSAEEDPHIISQGGSQRFKVPKTKVNLNGKAYKALKKDEDIHREGDYYENPGPLQFGGDTEAMRPYALLEEDRNYLDELNVLHAAIDKVRNACRPGCSSALLHMATKSLLTLTEVVETMDETSN